MRWRSILLSTLLAACCALVAGVLAATVRDPLGSAPRRRPSPVEVPNAGDVPAGGTAPAAGDPHPPATFGDAHPAPPSLSQRISSDDEGVRRGIALELLGKGPAALAQARALRPSNERGRLLQERLVQALQRLTLLQRSPDYEDLSERLRWKIELEALQTVFPDARFAELRQRYLEATVEALRSACAAGRTHAGELALAELELARVRVEVGEVDATDFAALSAERLPSARAWLAVLREERVPNPARLREVEERLRELER